MTDSCTCNQFDFPPTLKYHIVDGHAPTQYLIFWPLGAVGCAITAVVILPSIAKINSEAITIRDKMDTALLPFAFQICKLILLFPLIGALANMLV